MIRLRRVALLALAALLALPARPADIPDATRAVEIIRGLRFTEPVKTASIDRSELPDRLREQLLKTIPYSPDEYATVLRALQLVDPGTGDVVAPLLELYQAQVLAYYDPFTRTYYSIRELPAGLAGTAPAMMEQGVAIHELTHALQDQRFHIGARDWRLRSDSDAGLAYHALIEGEATLVMMAAITGQGGASLDEVLSGDLLIDTLVNAAAADKSLAGPHATYFGEMLKFPYLDGLRFVIAAYRRGGWKELDRVHADPPSTTRQILHPEEYFDRSFKPQAFEDAPPFEVPHLSVEHLGEFHWRYLLGPENARGWKNDRVTIAENRFCEPTVLVESDWDDPDAARRFYDAYRAFLDRRGVGSLARLDGSSVRVAYGADRPLMERFVR